MITWIHCRKSASNTLLIGALALLSAMASGQAQETASQPVTEASSSPEASAKMESEAVKRLELSLLYNKQLEEGSKLMAAGDLKSARERFKSVLDSTDGDTSFLQANLDARKGAARIAYLQSTIAEKNKDFVSARSLLEEAVALEPGNQTYQTSLARVKNSSKNLAEKYPGNKAVTPELEEKVNAIQKLMFEGDAFAETGQYKRAEGRFQQILLIDPYNTVAQKRIEKVNKKIEVAATERRKVTKERALANTERQWSNAPVERQKNPEVSVEGQSQSNSVKLMEKLEKIIIPEINFTDVDVVDAVKFLEAQSEALDPEKIGVNIVLKPEATSAATAAPTDPAAPAAPVISRTLTINLKGVPLLSVLDFIKSLTGLQYKVDEHAVFLFPSTESGDVMTVKSFSVPPTFFPPTVRVSPVAAGSLTGSTVTIATIPVQGELEKKGIKFPSGASAAYLPKTAKLVVRNTLDQLNRIDQLVASSVQVTRMVEIEAKFLEFSEDKLKEFSMNWRAYGEANPANIANSLFLESFPDRTSSATPQTGLNVGSSTPNFENFFPAPSFPGESKLSGGTALRSSPSLGANQLDTLLGVGTSRAPNQIGLSGIIAGSRVDLLISALESALGADLMSAPKIAVVNGQKSKIRIARELIYPTEYDPPEIVTGGTDEISVSIAVPSNPSSFETRDVGVTLEVKANATADRRIDLELTPKVTEFQGFINYGTDVTQSVTAPVTDIFGNPDGSVTNTSILAEGIALTPVFSNRTLTTKLQVIDGQTIVMGGFIREDKQQIEDKVPVLGDIPLLGRMFRSKVDRNIKKNLIMFITARMIRPDGTPEFLNDQERDLLELTLTPAGVVENNPQPNSQK